MYRLIISGLMVMAAALPAQAEMSAGENELRAAFKDFGVIGLAQAGSGIPVTEVRRDADGTNPRDMFVLYIDAAHAAEEVKGSSLADELEGRPFNAAELYLNVKGNVIWRTPYRPGATTSAPQVYYLTNAAGESVMMTINGETRTPMFANEADADSKRAAFEKSFSEKGTPLTLSVQSVPLEPLIERMMAGEKLNIYVYSSPSVIRWSEQWENGARLIKNYRTEQTDAFESLVQGAD